MALQPLSVEITHVRVKGFPSINALSALLPFLFSVLLVIGYYFITREKEEVAWKNFIIPTGIVPCHSDPLGN